MKSFNRTQLAIPTHQSSSSSSRTVRKLSRVLPHFSSGKQLQLLQMPDAARRQTQLCSQMPPTAARRQTPPDVSLSQNFILSQTPERKDRLQIMILVPVTSNVALRHKTFEEQPNHIPMDNINTFENKAPPVPPRRPRLSLRPPDAGNKLLNAPFPSTRFYSQSRAHFCFSRNFLGWLRNWWKPTSTTIFF